MKKKVYILLLFLISFPVSIVFSQTTNRFKLQIYLEGMDSAATAYLIRDVRTASPITDSVVLRNGYFDFSGQLDEPVKAYLVINHRGSSLRGAKDRLEFFLEPGILKLNGSDSISKVIFKSGTANAAYQDMLRAVKMSSSPRELYLAYIDRYADHISALEALYVYGGANPDPEEVEPLFLLLSEQSRKTQAGRIYEARLMHAKQTAIGKEAPDFNQKTPDGKTINLSDFRGHYVLIDFWASWCKPCRAENPHVVAAYKRYRNKGFTVLGVSLDNEKGRQAWIKAIADDGLVWSQVSDLKGWKNEAAKLYGVHAIPQNFLIDPKGIIIATNLRGDELQKKLNELFR